MTLPFACVIVMFVLLYATKLPVALAMSQQPKGYDNHNPRDQQASLSGWGKRAVAAHMNGFEAFPAFAAGVLIAHVGHGDPTWAAILAIVHVIARLAYLGLYYGDVASVRTPVWGLATACSGALMLLPAFSG